MPRATGANAKLLAAVESAYGVLATSGWFALPFVSSELSASQPLEDSDVLGLGREPAPPDRGNIDDQGNLVVKCDRRNFGFWLTALFGAPTTTGASGVFSHVFQSGAPTLPSLSIEIQNPEVPFYAQHLGVVANTCKLPWSTTGKVNATLGLVAQGETSGTTSQAGTASTLELIPFSRFQGAILKDGAALANITGAELTFANGLDVVRTIRPDGKIEGADPGLSTCKGSITARFADTVLMTKATSGDPIDLKLRYVLSAAASLEWHLPVVYLPRPKRSITGPGGIELSFDWQAAKPASTPFVTVTLINDVESYG